MSATDPRRTLAELAVLYELALAAGQSLDFEENCAHFLSLLMKRRRLSYAGVWLRAEHAPGAPEDTPEGELTLAFAIPSAHVGRRTCRVDGALWRRVDAEGPLSLVAGDPAYEACRFWEGETRGASALFPLDGVGYLALHAASRQERFSGVELAQLATVTRKFALTVEGCLAHHQAVREVALRRRLERERGDMEAQLAQAQKMEAVGRLAAGVAHDFNNLLTVISGHSELLLLRRDLEETVRGPLGQVQDAVQRAASVTRQLLAFSRKQVLTPRVVDVREVVGTVEGLLERVIGDDVELSCAHPDGSLHARVDPGQLEQVLMNLAVNARDAMPRGGRLSIRTSCIDLDEGFRGLGPCPRPGPHVCIAVTDTGCGMPPEVLEHVFEPFFTTKAEGQGTGLGLATVYGIVEQSSGTLAVESAPGQGTTFRVYLPLEGARPEPASEEALPPPQPGGAETVLLVEDDEALRGVAEALLTGAGYTVLTAGGGEAALALAGGHQGPIHALVTDVVMARMTGPELAQALGATRPDLRVLYVTGYADQDGRRGLPADQVLQKPFTVDQLRRRVRAVLDAPLPR